MWLWTVKFVAKCILQITLNILTKHFRPIDRIEKSYKQLTQLAALESVQGEPYNI